MNVLIDDSFRKDVKKIKDKKLLKNLREAILDAQNAKSILDLSNIKRLSGYSAFYRLRIGNFRAGLKLDNDELHFMRFLDRKDIYRVFPPQK